MTPIRITHFSDVLCVWAFVAQIRIEELVSEFGKQIEIDYRLLPVFGSAHQKIKIGWGEENGRQAYGRHVLEIANSFNHVNVASDVWSRVTPYSSLPSHLYLCATRLLEQKSKVTAGSFSRLAWRFREAFFSELQDISDIDVIKKLIDEIDLPLKLIDDQVISGAAYAELADDMKIAKDHMIKASPTLIFNEDRQRLTGNVGYRIIEANIRELIQKPRGEQSWC